MVIKKESRASNIGWTRV